MSDDHAQLKHVIEALVFAAGEPLTEKAIAKHLPDGSDVAAALAELAQDYAGRGIRLVRVGPAWTFRTAPDLAAHSKLEREVARKFSRAALETLGIIAYHQPVTRAEIEEIRGVALSKGSLDALLEAGWVKPGKRRRTPGRPLTWVTSQAFLDHFGLEKLDDLPGLEELKASGLLEARPSVHALRPGGDEGEDEDSALPADAEDESADPLELDETEIAAEDEDDTQAKRR